MNTASHEPVRLPSIPARVFAVALAVAVLGAASACNLIVGDDLPGSSSDASSLTDAGCAPDANLTTGGWDPCTNNCYRPGGGICAKGTGMDRCTADDGCNRCDCTPVVGIHGGVYGCTLAVCIPPDLGFQPDGAPAWPKCRDAQDCPDGLKCIFDPDPMQTLGRCSFR